MSIKPDKPEFNLEKLGISSKEAEEARRSKEDLLFLPWSSESYPDHLSSSLEPYAVEDEESHWTTASLEEVVRDFNGKRVKVVKVEESVRLKPKIHCPLCRSTWIKITRPGPKIGYDTSRGAGFGITFGLVFGCLGWGFIYGLTLGACLGVTTADDEPHLSCKNCGKTWSS